MVRVGLRQLQAMIEARKAAAGVCDTPGATDALRNEGTRRTPDKRELLRRVEDRARAAGLEPVKAHF